MQRRYNFLVRGLLPVLFLYFFWRSLREPGYGHYWSERLGYVRGAAAGTIWVHAASLGEMQAAAPLLKALVRQFPDIPVHVTTFTPTGRERAEALALPGLSVSYLPADTPGAVSRFLDRVRPRMLVVIETEFWPNLFTGCAARDIPVLCASARLSARSLEGLRRHLGPELLAHAVGAVSWVGAQSAADAQRFCDLGVAADRVTVSGNLKFDFELPTGVNPADQPRPWGQRPVWIAASTHEGEEEMVFSALKELRKGSRNLLLVVAPRHPQRFSRVYDLARRAQLSTARRSVQDLVDADTDVVLADTLGELPTLYSTADVAFVGGSLVPIGGHNLLEPAAAGVPIVVGPHTDAQKEIVERLRAEGGLVEIPDSFALAASIARLLQQPERRKELCKAAKAVLAANRGALARTLDQLRVHLQM